MIILEAINVAMTFVICIATLCVTVITHFDKKEGENNGSYRRKGMVSSEKKDSKRA